jgi:hypothetical protein
MPERVINDAVFQYKDAEGRRITAVRGQKVDIPEGKDLARGDKWGAFTPDGQEPTPPEGTFLPDIDLEWTAEEYNRLVDAAAGDEILTKLNAVPTENRAEVARKLIDSESSRGESAREELLVALNVAAEAAEGSSVPTLTTETDASLLKADGTEATSAPQGGDLVEFVSTNTIEAVLERVGDDPGLATAYREAEESRGDKARKTLIEQLTKIEYPEA